VYEALAEERAAICEFALRYPKIGYRKLTGLSLLGIEPSASSCFHKEARPKVCPTLRRLFLQP
jgi:hypothetical protein